MSRWKWLCIGDRTSVYGPDIICPDGRKIRQFFYDVGITDDGLLYNPHGYPEDLVRSAIAEAEERRAREHAAARPGRRR